SPFGRSVETVTLAWGRPLGGQRAITGERREDIFKGIFSGKKRILIIFHDEKLCPTSSAPSMSSPILALVDGLWQPSDPCPTFNPETAGAPKMKRPFNLASVSLTMALASLLLISVRRSCGMGFWWMCPKWGERPVSSILLL